MPEVDGSSARIYEIVCSQPVRLGFPTLPLDMTANDFWRSDKVGGNNSVIKTVRFSFPLHKSDGSAVIEDFYSGALQHFYLCDFSCRSINCQPKPAVALLVLGDSHVWIIRQGCLTKYERRFSAGSCLN
jgi:hypothetical protein